jgi:hypothetical protein
MVSAVAVMHADQIALFDSQQPSEPMRNADLEEFALYFGEAARTFSQFLSARANRDEENQLSIDSHHWPFQRHDLFHDATSFLYLYRNLPDGIIRPGTLGALSIELLAHISQEGLEPTSSRVTGEVTLTFTTSNFVR